MIIGITGHRPPKLGSYQIPNPVYNFVISETIKVFNKYKPKKIITGLCIGYDQYVARLAINLKIPFIAAIPFVGQELLWPKESQELYRSILEHAEQIEVVSPGAFASWKMHARNQWVVNNSDMIVSAFDGSKGGTYQTLEYARELDKKIVIIDPLKALKNDI